MNDTSSRGITLPEKCSSIDMIWYVLTEIGHT